MLRLRRAARSRGATTQRWTTSYSAVSRSSGLSKKLSNEAPAGHHRGDAGPRAPVAASHFIVDRDLASGLPLAILHRESGWPGRAAVQDGEVPLDGREGGQERRRLNSGRRPTHHLAG